ncbi:MAG TPA: tetratricopeptide repeat protein, partial [Spirochaetia bacterium]|nr:tetratricopeptide repeat protein [Spirochaetia bacterium]
MRGCNNTAGKNKASMLLGLILVLLWGGTEGSFARGAEELVDEGNAALLAGLLPEAVSYYERARQASPRSPVPLFNLGIALYKQNNLPAALTAFQSIEDPQGELAALTHFNQGNVLARLARDAEEADPEAALGLYNQSIAAYKRSLSLEPENIDAAFNIEVVRYWVDELLSRLTPGASRNSRQRASSDSKNKPDQSAPSQDGDRAQNGNEDPAQQ